MKRDDLTIEDSIVELACSFSVEPQPFEFLKTRATGIFFKWLDEIYLVTNWHVVTGCDPETKERKKNIPNRPEKLILNDRWNHREYVVELYTENNEPRWLQSTETVMFEGNPHVLDLVAIPLPRDSQFHPVDLLIHIKLPPDDIQLFPNQELIVVGYPYARLYPIWKTGHVAEWVQNEVRYFLMNGRTKPGMSGSAVYSVTIPTPFGRLCVGVYSGRYNDCGMGETLNDLDIGIVWKLKCLLNILPPLPKERDPRYIMALIVTGQGRRPKK